MTFVRDLPFSNDHTDHTLREGPCMCCRIVCPPSRSMVVKEMLGFGAPWPLILTVLLLQWTLNIAHGPIKFSDYFSGQGEQARALTAIGLTGHAHDLARGGCLKLAMHIVLLMFVCRLSLYALHSAMHIHIVAYVCLPLESLCTS